MRSRKLAKSTRNRGPISKTFNTITTGWEIFEIIWTMILVMFSQFSAIQREKLVTQWAKRSQSLTEWQVFMTRHHPVVVLKDALKFGTNVHCDIIGNI